MGREYPVSRGEPPLLQKGNGERIPRLAGRDTPFTKGEGNNFVAKKSQKSRKKVATLFYTFSEDGKKMSEKQEKKNAIADGEMAAKGVAGALPCAQNEK